MLCIATPIPRDNEGQRFLYRSLKILRGVRLIYSGLTEYIVHTREKKKHLFGLLMNGKFMVKKQGRQNIFPSAGARGLTSSCTLPPAPPSMKKLRSKGLYLAISLRHFGVTWDAHARCWSVCLKYCKWILPFFKGNLQNHHFIFIVYYQGRKVSSSFLWLNSFFPQSGLFPSNMFDEDTTPTVHAAGTADEGHNE